MSTGGLKGTLKSCSIGCANLILSGLNNFKSPAFRNTVRPIMREFERAWRTGGENETLAQTKIFLRLNTSKARPCS